ncbi:MAG TPA: YdcF family protein [Methylomirabilota bacterium]|nr:YdcF family protein [Methylomirabilota bacterium]
MSNAWLLRVVGAAGVAGFLTAAFTPAPNVVDHWLSIPARLEPAEALVVLGAGIDPDGTLANHSMRRLLRSVGLYKQRLAPLMVLSGPAARPGGPVEADARAQIARDMGVPPAAILTVRTAQTTREEAVAIAALLGPRGVRRVLLVTDSEHMPRAQRLFVRAGFEVLPAPVFEFYDVAATPEDRLALTRSGLQELAARVYYHAAGHF